MQKPINLIPSEMVVPPKIVNLIAKINKISTIGVVLLVVSIIITISVFVYFSLELNKNEIVVTNLKDQIVKLEKNEQKLILAKDRIAKIAAIEKLDSVDSEIPKLENILAGFSNSTDSAYIEITMEPTKTEISAISTSTSSMSSVMQSFYRIKDYKKIVLSSLAYNPKSGYLMSLIFSNK